MFLLAALPVACAPPQPGASSTPQEPPRPSQFVGKVWLSTDASAPPGTIRIFLPDGTLLMDSCGETYRLAKWRAVDDRRIEWTEDTARIEAQITRLTDDELQLRLQLRAETKDETLPPGDGADSLSGHAEVARRCAAESAASAT